MATNTSTENKVVLSGQSTSTIGSTTPGVQQARRLANASTNTPTIRNQRTIQADPNKMSKSIDSIGNAIGAVAQDTYALNNALVDEMVSDDNAMMAAGLDELDNSLKPGESREGIIKVASSYRGDLIAKKGDFDGNADMQARYKEKFIDTSAHKTMAYIKKWQGEEHQINYGKLKEEFYQWQTAEAPLLLKGLSGKPLLDAQKEVAAKFDKYTNELAAYGDVSKTEAMLVGSKRMTDNLFADFRGNYSKYVGGGSQAIIQVDGTVNSDNLAKFLDDKYFIYGDFKNDSKGWVSVDFKTKDVAVREEITSALSMLKTESKAAASGTQKEHAKFYNNLFKAVTTPGSEESTIQFGNHAFSTMYIHDKKVAQDYINEQFQMVFGYPPSADTQSIWIGELNKSSFENDQDYNSDRYIKDISIPVDRKGLTDDKAKEVYSMRSKRILTEYEEAQAIVNNKNSQPGDVARAQSKINFTKDRLTDNMYQNEMALVVDEIRKNIFTNPTTAQSANYYKQHRDILNTQGGQQYLRAAIGSVKEYNKALLYSALYDQTPEGTDFTISTELSNRINAMADGRLTKAEIELIQGYSLREDTMEGGKYMTYDESEKQLLINKTKLLLNPDADIDYSKNDFGADPYFVTNNHANIAGVKPTTNIGNPAAHSMYMKNYTDPETGKFTFQENLEMKVITDLVAQGKKDIADAVLQEGFILQEIDGAQGQYYIYSAANMMKMNTTLNLLEWNGKISEGAKLPDAYSKQLRAKQLYNNRNIFND